LWQSETIGEIAEAHPSVTLHLPSLPLLSSGAKKREFRINYELKMM
jgi:hypothetical protein